MRSQAPGIVILSQTPQCCAMRPSSDADGPMVAWGECCQHASPGQSAVWNIFAPPKHCAVNFTQQPPLAPSTHLHLAEPSTESRYSASHALHIEASTVHVHNPPPPTATRPSRALVLEHRHRRSPGPLPTSTTAKPRICLSCPPRFTRRSRLFSRACSRRTMCSARRPSSS
jgi:hypothetical protein